MGCGNITVAEPDGIKTKKSLTKILNQPNPSQNIKRQKAKDKMRQEMKEYQNIIKKKRKNLNQNGEIEDTDESEDSRLIYAKGKNFGKKRKKLTQEEIEDWMKQDEKEKNKRKGRKAHFSPMQKELPFKHREPEGKYDKHSSRPYSLGYEDEIYKDINYGKPIRLYDQTWLTYDVPVEPDVYNPKMQIPPGWRIPTLDDYKHLFKWIGNNEKIKVLLTHEKLLNMKTEFQYITTDKVFPRENNGYSPKAWSYFCIGFNFYDEVEYPGIEPLVPKKALKIVQVKRDKKEDNKNINDNEENMNTNKEEYDDAILSGEEDDFMKKMNKQLNKNKEDFQPVDENYIRKKTRLYTYFLKDNEIIKDLNREDETSQIQKKKKYLEDEEEESKNSEMQDDDEELNEDEKPKKFIFSVNTFKYSRTIRCKLIANEVLDLSFKCPLVIEAGYRSFFEIPKLFNITTFKWTFNDENCKPALNTSDKFIASHVFSEPGEYKIDLEIELFANRVFHLSKEVWVIDEILYGDEIIINGINYGQPIKIGNQIWLDRDILSNINYEGNEISLKRGKGPGIHGENSYIESLCACPNGWRLPFKEEIDTLLNYAGKNNEQKLFFFTKLEGGFLANLDESGFYDMVCLGFRNISKFEDYVNDVKNGVYGKLIADTKFEKPQEKIDEIKSLFKDAEKGNNSYDKKFLQKLKNYYNIILNNYNYSDIFNKEVHSLQIENNKVKVSFRSTSMSSPYSVFNTRCILDQKLDLDLGLKQFNFPIKTIIEFSLNYPNITNCSWNFGDSSKIIKDKLQVTHSYKEAKQYEINVELTLFGEFNYKIKKLINIFVPKPDTKLLNEDDIIIVPLGDFAHVKRTEEIHFMPQSAPIAPFIKKNGFYISYNEQTTNVLKLCQVNFDNTSESIQSCFEIPLYEEDGGIPLDIVCTELGCCLLVKDGREENNLHIELVSHKGELLWRNNIMQNGNNPLKAKINQFIFYNIYSEKIEYGTEIMFHPYSGRLSYGEGRIACIFSYRNNFCGKDKDDIADNSADIILTYNEEGTEVNLVCPWSTSHSLTQRALFDGKYFYTASLGDSEPHNIKVVRFEPQLPIHLGNYENEIKLEDEFKKIIVEKKEDEEENLDDNDSKNDQSKTSEENKDESKNSEISKSKKESNNSERNENESKNSNNNNKEESKKSEKSKEESQHTGKSKKESKHSEKSKEENQFTEKSKEESKKSENTRKSKEESKYSEQSKYTKKSKKESEISKNTKKSKEESKYSEQSKHTKKSKDISKNTEENKDDENNNEDNLSYLLLDNNVMTNNDNIDINLQFYFPLQNKLIDNSEILNINSDKSLKNIFKSKKYKLFRQNEHLKLSIRHKYISKNIIEGWIPGNFCGQSSGRLGGFHLLPDNKLVMVYSRIPCDNNYGKKNDVSELCFLSFDTELKKIKSKPFRNGANINIIKNARYGDNIFILISETTKVTDDRKFIYDKYSFYSEQIEEDHLPCNCFLVDKNGELVSDLFSFDFNFFSPNDDFKTLNDGSVVWTFVDDDDNLSLCFLALGGTLKYLKKFSDETMTAGKYNDFLIQKREEEEEEKKRKEKEFLRSIGIDDDLIKRRLLESELMEKERIAKELEEKRLQDEARQAEEAKKKKEEEEKEEMMKEIEEEAKLREQQRLEEEEKKKKEEEEKEKKKKKKGKDWDFSESDEEEEEEVDDNEPKDDNLSNYYM